MRNRLDDIIWNEYDDESITGALQYGPKSYTHLKNQSILLVCWKIGGIERALLHLMLALNHRFALSMKITCCEIETDGTSIADELQEREPELCILPASRIKEAGMQDIVCHTLLCNRDSSTGVFRADIIFEKSMRLIAESCKPKKWITCTDFRVFADDAFMDILHSEKEVNVCGRSGTWMTETSMSGALENLTVSMAKQMDMNWQIIRTGAVLGNGISGCTRLQQMFAGNGDRTDESCKDQAYDVIPYIFLSDFLQGFLWVLCCGNENEVYHLADKTMNYSGLEIAGMVSRLTGEKLDYGTGDAKGCRMAMNADKLGILGYRPQWKIEQAVYFLQQYKKERQTPVFSHIYDGKIRKIQKVVLQGLLEVDRICKKHGITYALGGGTLLGAVRHHGFIPWDEDADLIMERDAYERFLEVAKDELPPEYFLQTPQTDPANHFYTKIRINQTILSTKFTSRIEGLNQGIFIDIFCHDKTSNRKLVQKLHIYATIVARSLVFNKWGNTSIAGKDGKHALLRRLFTQIKKILPMSVLERMQFGVICFFKNRKNARFLYDGMGQNVRNGVFPKSWIEHTVLMQFEGYDFPVPEQYDLYLRFLYGDYEKMIPVSARMDDSYAKWVDLGAYYTIEDKTDKR